MEQDPLTLTLKAIILLSVATVSFSILGITGVLAVISGLGATTVLLLRKYQALRT